MTKPQKPESEIQQAIALLDVNLDRFERLNDPTHYEVNMYRHLWEVRCHLQEQLKVSRILVIPEEMERVTAN